MRRKLTTRARAEAAFGPDWCRIHVAALGQHSEPSAQNSRGMPVRSGSVRKRRPHREPRVALGPSRSDVLFSFRSTPIQSTDPTGNPELHSGRRAATRFSACDQLRFSRPTPSVTRPCCPNTTRGSVRKHRPHREPRVALGPSRSDAFFGLRSTSIQSTHPRRHPALLPEYNSGFRSQAPSSPGTPSCTRDVAQRRAVRLLGVRSPLRAEQDCRRAHVALRSLGLVTGRPEGLPVHTQVTYRWARRANEQSHPAMAAA